MANSPSGNSVITRVVRILAAFDSTRTKQSISALARRSELPMSTAHRLVGDLTAHGLLERDERGDVFIGMRLWELAARGSHALELRQAAMPFMEDVQAVVRQHTQLAVLENNQVLFIERLSSRESGANITQIAGRLPLHASSSGLVLLAYAPADYQEQFLASPLLPHSPETITDAAMLRKHLARVRRQGYVVAPGYIAEESTGLAVPVTDAAGQVVAALSVVMPRGQEKEEASVLCLMAAARGITRMLIGKPSH